MAIVSQFFICNLRGDPIVFRDFCGDFSTDDVISIFHNHQDTSESQSPVFTVQEMQFISHQWDNFYFVIVTKVTDLEALTKKSEVLEMEDLLQRKTVVDPPFFQKISAAVEFLDRMAKLMHNFLGDSSEKAVRQNHLLINYLLSEMVDAGVLLETSSHWLKLFTDQVKNEGFDLKNLLPVSQEALFSSSILNVSSAATTVFIDIDEQINLISENNTKTNFIHLSLGGSLNVKAVNANSEVKVIASQIPFLSGEERGIRKNGCVRRIDHRVNDTTHRFESKVHFLPVGNEEFCLLKYHYLPQQSSERQFTLPFNISANIDVDTEHVNLFISLENELFQLGLGAFEVDIKIDIPASAISINREILPTAKNTNLPPHKEFTSLSQDRSVLTWHLEHFHQKNSVLKVSLFTKNPKLTKSELPGLQAHLKVPLWVASGMDVHSVQVLQVHAEKFKRYSTTMTIDLQFAEKKE